MGEEGDAMLCCTTGQLQERQKGGKNYYWIRLNLVDTNAKTRKDRYKDKYIPTGLLVGGKTGRIKNLNLANEQLTQAIRDFTPVGASMQFDKYVMYWMEEIKKGHDHELSTKEAYANKARYIVDFFKDQDLTLSQVDVIHIRAFSNHLHEITSSRGKPLSDVYIRDILKTTKQIFSFAQINGDFSGRSPFASFKMPKVKKKSDDEPYIREDQVDDFKQLVRSNCDGNYILEAAFLICLFYGLRREELCGLKWSAIRHNKLHIEYTVTRVKTLVSKDRAKSNESNRSCDIYPEIAEHFSTIKEHQENNRALFGRCYQDSDFIFTWEDGHPFAPDYLTHKFRHMIDKSEALDKRLHLHSLRATCVSLLAHKGKSLSDIAQWIGDSIETTERYYLRTSAKDKYETGQAMAEILF